MDWDGISRDHRAVAEQVFSELRPAIERAAELIVNSLREGGKLLICGNGGSAADAQHIAGEFLNRFLRERRPYAAIALTTDTSTITAIGNDYTFDQIFEKQLEALGRPGDVLLAISTSGRAVNVLRAVRCARAKGMTVIALTGGSGGELAPLAHLPLIVSVTRSTPRIQEGHLLIYHALCERVEELMETS